MRKLALQYARDHSVDLGRVQRSISFMMLGGALERMRGAGSPGFTIKGGVALELRLPASARATKDLDIVVNSPGVDLIQEVDHALEAPYGGFSFRRKAAAHDLGGGILRIEIALEYRGGAWGTVPIDLTPRESPTATPEMISGISLEPFGLNGPAELPCLSLPHHIAQKIHGMTRPSTAEWVNDRERDLIDLILLEELAVDLRAVRDACVEVFRIRDTHPWPPRDPLPESWAEPVMALARELALPAANYQVATRQVWAFINRIDATR